MTAWNRSADKAAALADAGIAVAGTVSDAIASSSIILLTLADAATIQSTILTDVVKPLLKGKTVLQMGTIGASGEPMRNNNINLELQGCNPSAQVRMPSRSRRAESTCTCTCTAFEASLWAPAANVCRRPQGERGAGCGGGGSRGVVHRGAR